MAALVPKVNSASSAIVTSDGVALAANRERVAFMIQNLDDAAVYVKLGSGASSNDASFVLQASTASNDGKGGAYSDRIYTGVVSIAAATGAPRVAVVEL